MIACLTMVLVAGIEPARVLPHGILSPGRLPVSPHQHSPVQLVYHAAARSVNLCAAQKEPREVQDTGFAGNKEGISYLRPFS